MMFLYRILFLPVFCLSLPYYLLHMWRRGGYRQGFLNRFGMMGKVPPKSPGVKRIWIQAVSVGELNAIRPLVDRIQAEADLEVIVTTTTSTGYSLLRGSLVSRTSWSGIFPLDFWPFSASAWKSLQPDMAILMEGELWPEHIHQARQRGVPVLLINARLSDKSYRRHLAVRNLSRYWFSHLTAILAGSKRNARRFRSLEWIPPERIHETGNLKLDVSGDLSTEASFRQGWLEQLGFVDEPDPLIFLGASTWPGEETLLLETFSELEKEFPNLRLLLVPRHAERGEDLLRLVRKCPYSSHLRTRGRTAPPGTRIHVANTTGELKQLTALADLVFIGKSMPPNRGGQTPIEAASQGRPIIMGPEMSNFRDIARQLVRKGAAVTISEPAQLTPTTRELLNDSRKRQALGEAGARLVSANRGTTRRTFERIRNILDGKSGGAGVGRD